MLSVWLPGNKDIRNQGLTYSEPEGSFSIVEDNPFGMVMHTTSAGNVNTKVLSTEGWDLSTGSCGFGAWLKFNLAEMRFSSAYTYTSSYNCIHNVVLGFNSYGGISLDLTSNNIYNDGAFNSATLQAHLRYNTTASSAAKTIEFDKWHHWYVQYSKERGKLELYYDGTLASSANTSSVPVSALTKEFMINNGTVWGGNPPGKYLSYYVSDARVYNNELTADEIKRIVSHKMFDIGKTFYYEEKTNLLDYSNIRGHGSSFELTSEIFDGSAVYRNTVTSPNTGNNAGFAIRQPITATGLSSATKISISFYKKLVSVYGKNLGGYIRVVKSDATEASYSWSYNKPSWANDSQSIGEWEYITSTVTIPTGCTQIKYVYVYTDKATGGVCDYSKIQLELNATPTQYCLGHRDEILFDANGTNGIQYSSGVVKSGSTLYFDGTNSYIQTSELDFMKMVDSAYTFSFWVNSQEATSSRSVYFGGGNQGNGWTFNLERFASSNKFRIYNNQAPDWTVDGCVITANTWIHIVATRSGNTVTVYKNGVSVGTKTGFTNHTSFDRTYYIGSDYRSGDTRFKGYIGDFKIYANPFTADDVLRLYNKEKLRYQ